MLARARVYQVRQSVRNWADRGKLRVTRLGTRRVRIRRSELEPFLEAGESVNVARETDGRELTDALRDALSASEREDPAELAAALRSLSKGSQPFGEVAEGGPGSGAGRIGADRCKSIKAGASDLRA